MIAISHDIAIADQVAAAVRCVRPGAAGRFGDRKVFIAAAWDAMCDASDDHWIPARVSLARRATIADFRAWLLAAMRFTDASGRPLVVLARADLVAAMDPYLVAASETLTDGASYHFIVDRGVAPELYAPRGGRR